MQLTFTEKARERVGFYMKEKNPKEWGLRIRVKNGKQDFALEDLRLVPPMDETFAVDGLQIIVDAGTKYQIEGAKVDYIEGAVASGFAIEFKPAPPPPKLDLADPMVKKVFDVLESDINPYVASHGGHIKLLNVQGDTVYVEMSGGCQGCGMAAVTLKQGIETRIKEVLPQIKNVIDTTDHAGGTNPYFSPR